jgi:hypothetical protein
MNHEPISPDERERWWELDETATARPWHVREPQATVPADQSEDRLVCARDENAKLVHIAETFQYQCHQHNDADGTSPANADLIAEYRTAVPRLLAENAALREELAEAKAGRKHIDIVFDGPPGPVAGRFVEVEAETGASIRCGKWIDCDGLWRLRIDLPTEALAQGKRVGLEEARKEARRWCKRWDDAQRFPDVLSEMIDRLATQPPDEAAAEAGMLRMGFEPAEAVEAGKDDPEELLDDRDVPDGEGP